MLVQPRRIDNQTSRQNSSRRASVKSENATPGLFAQMLAATRKAELNPRKKNARETLGELLAELEESEQRFAANPDSRSFQEYRAVVRRLTSFLLQQGHQIEHLKHATGKHHYEIVKIIDQKMSELLRHFMRRRNDVVIALHVMGEIRGLVVHVLS